LRFLVRLVDKAVSRDTFLASMRALAKSMGAEARNPKWTSYGALELDVFTPTRADLDLFLAAVSPLARVEFTTDLNMAQEHMADDEVLSRARNLFNAERYWECHEILEGLWRQKGGDEKRLLQGMILICAAFVHHQKGEETVALGVLRRGVNQLEFHQQMYREIDVNRLKDNVQRVLTTGVLADFKV